VTNKLYSVQHCIPVKSTLAAAVGNRAAWVGTCSLRGGRKRWRSGPDRRLCQMAERAEPGCRRLPHRRLAAKIPATPRSISNWASICTSACGRARPRQQIADLKRHGMPVICEQNDWARKHLGEKIIVGWMHGDEPDNASRWERAKGYGPPILPEKIIQDYQKIRANDSSRPVLLNLGQGVAGTDGMAEACGRAARKTTRQYVQGGDIVSFDIYRPS